MPNKRTLISEPLNDHLVARLPVGAEIVSITKSDKFEKTTVHCFGYPRGPKEDRRFLAIREKHLAPPHGVQYIGQNGGLHFFEDKRPANRERRIR